jgi:hypothetical protein
MLIDLGRNLLVAALGGVFLAAGAGPMRAPVLIELFTSEGCDSCPPADKLLETLDPSVIVLSEHVDYWDHLGWRDPFSAHNNTVRQESYARHLAIQGPYTPQMVVDGTVEFNGADARRASDEIARAAKREKTAVRLTRNGNALKIETDGAVHASDVMLAIAEDSAASQVAAGENKGKRLHHVAILRSLRKIGSVKRGATFAQSVDLGADSAGKRVIVFLQDGDLGRISGAGSLVP